MTLLPAIKVPWSVTLEELRETKFVAPPATDMNWLPRNETAAVGLVMLCVKLEAVPVPTARVEAPPLPVGAFGLLYIAEYQDPMSVPPVIEEINTTQSFW